MTIIIVLTLNEFVESIYILAKNFQKMFQLRLKDWKKSAKNLLFSIRV